MYKNLKNIIILILSAIIIFSSNSSVYNVMAFEQVPENTNSENQDEEVITIAAFDIGNSFFYDEAKKRYSGYLVDFMKELSKYEDFEYRFILCTWEESLQKVKNGEIDICPFVNISDEREEVYDFSKHSFGPDGGFLYTNREDIFYNDFANFNGKRIGFISEFQIKENFKKFASVEGFSYIPVLFKNESDMISALETGRVDMITGECMQTFEDYRKVAKFQMGEYYFISAKGNEALDKINNALSFQRWYDPDIDLKIYTKYYNLSDEIPVYTRDEFNFVSEAEEFTIAILSDRYVQSSYDKNDKVFYGIEPDIVREIENISGLKLKMIPVRSGENLITMVEKGYADMSMGVSHIDQYLDNEIFSYTDSIIETPHTLAIRKNDNFDLNGYKKVSIPITFPAAKIYIENEYSNWQVVDEYNLGGRLDTVLSGETDCTIISRYELQYLLQMPKYRELTMYPTDFKSFDSSIIVSKDINANAVSVLNKAIESIKYNSIDAIINSNIASNNYYSTFWEDLIEYKEFVVVIILLLFGLFLILYISYKLQKDKNMKLEGYIEELNISNDKLNMAYMKVQKAEKAASDANRIKSDFLARMSHDMRTPMNAIISISDFGSEESTDERDIDYFKQIKVSSLYLLGLLNDILEIQKLESDEIELIPSSFNFALLFSEIVNITKYRALRKHIEFETDFDNRYDDLNIYADKKRLEQSIINLINNAIKYTKPFGHVSWKTRIKKYTNDIKVIHTISDDGIGMTEEFQKKMFDPFTQEYNELSDNEFGTGLGLAIVSNIVNLMDGEIKCKSKLGKGTKFTITMVHKLSPEVQEDVTIESRYLHNILAGKKILVCEDNIINSKIIIKILEKHGIITDLAENGKIGVEKTINNEYDLILMDIRMPVMDGLEAAIEIRKFNINVPIVALSANAYEEDVQKSLAVGMNAHIAKPIDKDELFSQIAYWILDK